jgi:hypothetical protein
VDQGADSATVDESRLGQVDDHIRARGDDGVERGSERGNGGKVVFAEQRTASGAAKLAPRSRA